MSLVKPYEISLWEDKLSEDGTYYEEVKLGIIGSDTMEAQSRAYNPVFTKTVDGSFTLTFSMVYRYWDFIKEKEVTNFWIPYLVAERKVKLHYNDEWYDFVIKECNESTDNEFTYTCNSLFTNELGRVGYNITLSTDLGNNLGNIFELAEKAVEGTDWKIDREHSDIIKQLVAEPLVLFAPQTTQNVSNIPTFQVINLTQNNREETLEFSAEGERLLVFYSEYLNSQDTPRFQFLHQKGYKDGEWTFDNNNVAYADNYMFKSAPQITITGESGSKQFTVDGVTFTEGSLITEYQGYRLAYAPRVTYDPIMERTVNLYEAQYDSGAKSIYQYTDYEYITSDIVQSYVTNGADFNMYNDGTLEGWSNATPTEYTIEGVAELQPAKLVTIPDINQTNTLEVLSAYPTIGGYLELIFGGNLTNDYQNTFFNSGFDDYKQTIDHISKGDKYVLRVAAGRKWNNKVVDAFKSLNYQLQPTNALGAIVARYTTEEKKVGENDEVVYVNKIDPTGIILQFDPTTAVIKNNEINTGTFNDTFTQYIIDGIVTTPAFNYIYKQEGDNNSYYWNPFTQKYELATFENFLNSYYMIATSERSFTNKDLQDIDNKFGIFFYKNDAVISNTIYVRNVELFKYYDDGDETPVLIGNVPKATSIETDYYYVAPAEGTSKEAIEVYSSKDSIAEILNIDPNKIVQVYNADSEKISSIEEEKSNCFNIIQSLCESFECWAKFHIEHEENGAIKLDSTGAPYKSITFHEYVGKDNFAGFKYGINEQSIQRTVQSDEIVSKTIVEQVPVDVVDGGTLTIRKAQANPSGESYILNFSYYLNNGLIKDRTAFQADYMDFITGLKELNNQYNDLIDEINKASIRLTTLNSKRTIYSELVEEAQTSLTETRDEFKNTFGIEYEAYVAGKSVDLDKKTEDEADAIKDYIGRLFTYQSTINNYSGLNTNTKKEYRDLDIEINGTKDYTITVRTRDPINNTEGAVIVDINDYLEGIKFTIDGNEFESGLTKRHFEYEYTNFPGAIAFTSLPLDYRVKIGDNAYEAPVSINLNQNASKEIILTPTKESQKEGLVQEAKNILAEKDKIEKKFYTKYSRYIQEGSWTSSDYIDHNLYYMDALQVSNTSSHPRITYSLDVSEVSEVPGLENYSFDIGDKTYIEDPQFFGTIKSDPIDIQETFEIEEPYEGKRFKLTNEFTTIQSITIGGDSYEVGIDHNTNEVVIGGKL